MAVGWRVIGSWILASRLAAAITGADVPLDLAAPFALAAVYLCADVPLCAAIAVRESRLVPTAVNPRTHVWGVGQVNTRHPRRMTAWNGTAAMERKLVEARLWCGRRGPVCPVAVYVAGNGWRGTKAQRRARRVIYRAAVLRARLTGATDPRSRAAS
jgi:hypothetical protein